MAVVALLAAQFGCAHQVTIDSLPRGARVIVDGKDVGRTPVQIEDRGTPGSTTRIIDVYDDPHRPIRISVESTAQGKPVLGGLAVGVGTAAAMVVTGTALLAGSKSGSGASSAGAAMCLVSPLGLAAGIPLLVHGWQMDNETYMADFTGQDREKAAADLAAAEERARQDAAAELDRGRAAAARSAEQARLDAQQEAIKRARELEEHWTQVCAGMLAMLDYDSAIECGNRAAKTLDKEKAFPFWAQAISRAYDSWQICDPANRIISNAPKPERFLRGVSPLVLDQCRERRQCLIQCQTAHDACYNEPVEARLLDEHTIGCDAAHTSCERACLK